MRTFFMILICVLTFGCAENKQNYILPSSIEIQNVVKALIEQDSLHVKRNHDPHSYYHGSPLCSDLFSLNIALTDSLHKFEGNFILYSDLVCDRQDHFKFFSNSDSSYILFQLSRDSFILDTAFYPGLNWTKIMTRKELIKDPTTRSYFTISIPVFSSEGSKAYCTMNNVCDGLCGYGMEYFLEKRKGNWFIIRKRQTWVS